MAKNPHQDNPDKPGWCAKCGCAYPCPCSDEALAAGTDDAWWR